MITKTTAFLTRSLRQESRLTGHHLMRAGLAAVMLFMFFGYLESSTRQVGAGGTFARTVLYCCYFFLTAVGGLYFSIAIVEEKEEQTLPLLRMTGATPLTILLGKSVPRLTMVLLFILISAPFLILSVTLGGVLIPGLLTSLLGMLIYAVMLSQIGTLASVICDRGNRAFLLTTLAWVILEVPGIWTWLLVVLTESDFGLYDWFTKRSLLQSLGTYMTTWGATAIWHPQMTFHLGVAVTCLLLSRALFERMTASAMAGTAARGPVMAGKAAPEVVAPDIVVQRRLGKRPVVTGDALAWKSREYVAGGRGWMLIRIVLVPIAIVILLSIVLQGQIELENIAGAWTVGGILFALSNTARLLGHLFNAEIKSRTMSGLLMLPVSRSTLVFRMLRGLVPAVVSAGATVAAGVGLLLLVTEPTDIDWIELLIEPWFLHCLPWAAATLMVGMVLSVRMRYGGMLLGMILGGFVGPVIVGNLLNHGPFGDFWFEYGLFSTVEVAVCWLMWRRLIEEIEAAGTAA